MTLKIDPRQFRFPEQIAAGVRGKRVFVTGAGTDGGLGQAFACAAAFSGAECVALHFDRMYETGLATVDLINENGGNAFAAQADLTNIADAWSLRTRIVSGMGGLPPDLIIMNSDRAESGYRLGKPRRLVEGEPQARRRARVRQAFIDNLGQSVEVLDSKLRAFLSMTHLWAGEAHHHGKPLQIVYISSRQALDPGPGVPGFVLANFGVLWLPQVLAANLGSTAPLTRAFSVVLPFVRSELTEAYSDKPQFWDRWQPRIMETHEAAECMLRLLASPEHQRRTIYQLNLGIDEEDDRKLRATWSGIRMSPLDVAQPWSEQEPASFPLEP